MLSKEMEEMDKAFNDFNKACAKAIDKCQDFIDMDINKTTEPTLEERANDWSLTNLRLVESSPADDARKIPKQRDEVADVLTYELWYLGDIYDRGVKNRETLNSFLIEAGSLMRQGIDAGLQVGGVEICEVNTDGRIVDSVWSMNIDEFKKVSR